MYSATPDNQCVIHSERNIIMMIHFHVVPIMLFRVVGLILYVEEEDITSWFNAASDDDEATHEKISVIHKSATSVEVTFSSGTFGLVL